MTRPTPQYLADIREDISAGWELSTAQRRALLAELDALRADLAALKASGREAIDRGEELIATMQVEREQLRDDLAVLRGRLELAEDGEATHKDERDEAGRRYGETLRKLHAAQEMIGQLRSDLAAVTKGRDDDRRRLDWMQEHEAFVDVADDEAASCSVHSNRDYRVVARATPYNIRDAIDAALGGDK